MTAPSSRKLSKHGAGPVASHKIESSLVSEGEGVWLLTNRNMTVEFRLKNSLEVQRVYIVSEICGSPVTVTNHAKVPATL